MSKSFRDFRGLTNLTPAEIVRLKQHCNHKNVIVNTHYLYMGREGNGYAQTTFDFRGVTYHMYRHQLSLYLKKFDDGFDFSQWDDTKTSSHLCGKRRCINPDHLELESMDRNTERVRCHEERRCFGHGSAPNCIIWFVEAWWFSSLQIDKCVSFLTRDTT